MGTSIEGFGGFMGEALKCSKLLEERVGTSGILGDFQPVFDPAEEGEELPKERSEIKGRENSVDIEDVLVDMEVLVRGWGWEDEGVQPFLGSESGLCMFQVPFWDAGIFFS